MDTGPPFSGRQWPPNFSTTRLAVAGDRSSTSGRNRRSGPCQSPRPRRSPTPFFGGRPPRC
eukprot:1857519-Alexandrium_andersonii.AAC.1